MNIKEAKDEIKRTLKAYTGLGKTTAHPIPVSKQRPILMIGPPGIGKTAIMEQIAQECGAGLVSYTMTHHTRQSAIGLPYLREESFDGNTFQVTEYTMSEIIASVYECIRTTGHRFGILFIDEINCVSETLVPIMLQLLCKGGAAVLPKAYFEENGEEAWLANPIGSGPYQLTEYVKDDHVTLVPFADYYGEQNPDWEEVIFRVVPESSTRVGELIAGNVDAVNMVIPTEWERVNGNEGTAVVNGPSTRVYQLALKTDKGPTADLRVRQAIDLAIDDQTIVDTILQGAGTPMLTRVPSGVNGCNEDLVGKYNYDPERAKELLAEAGYPDGFSMKIEAPTGRYTMDAEISQAIVAMLSQVGITVDLQLLESSAYSNVFSAHSAEDGFMTCFGLGFFDASYGMIGYFGVNTSGESNWNNQEYIDMYYEAEFNMNEEERTQLFQEMQQMVADEVPYAIICQIDNSYGVKDSITMTPRLDDVWNLSTIRKV